MFPNLLLIFINYLIVVWFKINSVEGIVGGHFAGSQQFKYQVSLQINFKHVCGGAIVSERHALTAAECIIDENNNFVNEHISIAGGVIDLKNGYPYKVVMEVGKAYVPLEYKRVLRKSSRMLLPSKGNIAVLQTKLPMTLGKKFILDKILLPKNKLLRVSLESMKNVIVLGFGIETPLSEKEKVSLQNKGIYESMFEKLKFAHATVVQKGMCPNTWNAATIQDVHISAQIDQVFATKAGTCYGDVGGPLVLDRDIIIGILTTHHSNCSEEVYSSIYTSVASYLNFINRAMNGINARDIRLAEYGSLNVIEIITDRDEDLVTIPKTSLYEYHNKRLK